MAKKPQGGNPAAHKRKKRGVKPPQQDVHQPSTTSKLITLWRNANLMQKRGVVLAAIIIAGSAVTLAIKTSILPNSIKKNAPNLEFCLRSTSPLPFKTNIVSMLGRVGEPIPEVQQFMIIEAGLNKDLAEAKQQDTGAIISKATRQKIGHFQGTTSIVERATPIDNLPMMYSLTIANRDIEISESDRFTVTGQAVKIGKHSFAFNEVVTTVGSANMSIYMIPIGRVYYNVIGRNPAYECVLK